MPPSLRGCPISGAIRVGTAPFSAEPYPPVRPSVPRVFRLRRRFVLLYQLRQMPHASSHHASAYRAARRIGVRQFLANPCLASLILAAPYRNRMQLGLVRIGSLRFHIDHLAPPPGFKMTLIRPPHAPASCLSYPTYVE